MLSSSRPEPQVRKCDRPGCPEIGAFQMASHEGSEWLCFGHFQTTPYGQALMADQHRRILGDAELEG